MKTLENSKHHLIPTLLAVDFLAKIFPLLEAVKESLGSAPVCGLKCTAFVGKLDQGTSSLKTAQLCCFEASSGSYATFPKSGMMQNGSVYLLPHLESNRVGNDFIVLPTPVKSSANAAAKNRYFGSPSYRSNIQEYIRDSEQDGTYPNPELLENLMMYPINWTELKQSGTP
jgi:hypothetical protein